MAFTAEQLTPVFAYFEVYKDYMEPNFSLAYDYLSGKVNLLPAFKDHSDNRHFSHLYQLAIQPGISPTNEALLFSFLTCPPIVKWVKTDIAYRLFSPLFNTTNQAAFDQALAEAHKYSCSNEDLFFFLVSYAGITKERILSEASPVLDFMHGHIAQMGEAAVNNAIKYEKYGAFNPLLFYFLYQDKREKSFEYIDNWMLHDNGYTKVDQVVLRTVLEFEFEKYGPKYVAAADDLRLNARITEAFNTYFLYNEFAKERDLKELILWSELYFDYFIRNVKKYETQFSSFVYNMGSENYFTMPAHGWALYFISLVDKDRVKELLEKFSDKGVAYHYNVLLMLTQVLEEGAIPFIIKAVYQKDELRFFEAQRLKFIFDELTHSKDHFDINILWEFGKYATKQAEILVIQFLIEHDKDVVAKAIKTLDDKKKEKRLMAARILFALNAPETIEPLKGALDKETDDATRDLIWQICGREISAPVTEETVTEMVEGARKRGKLKKPVFSWLDETMLPPLYFQSGRQLTADELRLILYRLSLVKGIRTDAEIKPVLQLIDKERSAVFAKAVYKDFEDKGFDAKYKFLLLLAAIFGDDDMVSKFCSGINKWIETNRKVMCEYGIEALALQGSNKALRWIEWYSRKFRSKKAYISEAGEKALTAAAEEQEISVHELGDRIVPDFGFEGLFKHLTVNGEEYRAFVDSNFKLAYFNEDNKKLKSIPSAAGKELVDEFKAIAKEVRDVVKAQSSRLEHYLVVQRKWAIEEWQQFFLNNPIMFIYATKLLWGVYDKENKLVSCFLCQEDTTLVDKEGNEIEAPEGYFIGIVHPISLTAEDLQAWKRQFFDLSVEPVFPQLERPVYIVAEEDKAKRVVQTFVDVPSDSGSIKNTLDKQGWRKGSGESGVIDAFHYLDRASKIEAELEVEGVFVYGFDDEATLGKLFFVDTTVKTTYKAGVTNTDMDERLVELGKLSPIFYSEVVAAVKAIKVKEKP